MTEKLKPLGELLLIEPIENERKINGIIIPDDKIEKPLKGKIVAMGTGIINNDNTVKRLTVEVGMTVLFGKYSATETRLNQKQFLLVRESDLLGILYNEI